MLVDGAPAVPCLVDMSSPHQANKLICVTAEATAGSGLVRVKIDGPEGLFTESRSKFTFYVCT